MGVDSNEPAAIQTEPGVTFQWHSTSCPSASLSPAIGQWSVTVCACRDNVTPSSSY